MKTFDLVGLEDDEEYRISKIKQRKSSLGKFTAVSRIDEEGSIFDAMLGISRKTHEVLLEIMHNREKDTNVYIFQTKGVNPIELKIRSKHLLDLQKRGIIRRISIVN